MPEINEEEILHALQSIKNDKVPRNDTTYMEQGKIPDNWNNVMIAILFKKGDASRLQNYLPISAMS